MGTAYSDGSGDRGRGMLAGSGWQWKEYGEGMVMNRGGRGVALLSFGGGGVCDTVLLAPGRAHLWHLPMCCRFQGILST